jgi:hypothetical protein
VLAGGAAATSILGGVAVGRLLRPKRRKVLGIPVTRPRIRVPTPSLDLDFKSLTKNASSVTKLDVDSVAGALRKTGKQVGRAGEQLARIANDVEKAGQTVERVGKLLSK